MKPVIFMVGAATIGFLAGGATTFASRGSPPAAAAAEPAFEAVEEEPATPEATMVSGCDAVDGDTLRCGAERIRLVGIDSPEMPGHCREGRQCVEGDPLAARAALSGSVSLSMPIRRFGTDRYGRTLALVEGPLGDLSCSQLRSGHAIYRADWDVEGKMMKGCGGVVPPQSFSSVPEKDGPAA